MTVYRYLKLFKHKSSVEEFLTEMVSICISGRYPYIGEDFDELENNLEYIKNLFKNIVKTEQRTNKVKYSDIKIF